MSQDNLESLAVAKIAEQQLSSSTESEAEKSSALALYNRAAAELAADVPALIQKGKTAGTISLKDSQSGQTNQLQLESGKRGEYPPTYFQQILVAARVDRKGMRDNAVRAGLGGEMVGVYLVRPLGSSTSPGTTERSSRSGYRGDQF